MRIARPMLIAIVLGLLAACGGETEVQGGGVDTGPTAPTATGPTATGPTAETAETDPFGGPVELELTARQNPTGAAMFSCDGLEGTWTYDPGTIPVQGVEISIEPAEVDMSGGTGTLVIEGEITIPAAGTGTFTDTVELQITGSADSPAMESTGVRVEASGVLEGFGFDVAQFFPEKVSIPIVADTAHC